ncbi:hypothetical protein B0T24DRAFT_661227 [Lasiosphaeria ovina]|uniref:HNH nuclease domain-containing protein n=1 Tax=Lasiosphaeria ovina TaxID=92902 RepID=A0AAE0NJE6_9PEZI|nr:hypothetical protein B0T24DRAFT_661227 [Lasiosphaeria ovina]
MSTPRKPCPALPFQSFSLHFLHLDSYNMPRRSARIANHLSAATPSDEKPLSKCLDFLQSEPTVHDRDTLMRYVDADAVPQREPVTSILPLDELHERLDRMGTIEGYAIRMMPPTWEPNIYHFAALLLAPIGYLRQLADAPMLVNTLDLHNMHVPQLVRLFLATSRDVAARSNLSTSGANSLASGSKGKRKRAASHGAGSSEPRTAAQGDDATYEPGQKFDANALCLVGKAYFGFKCLGILPGDEPLVRVRFVWMPRAMTMWQKDCRDEDELRVHMNNDRSPLVEQGVAAFRLSGRPLSTGDVFDIPVAKADAKKMKMAFDLQWVLIRIAALTGGADVDDVGTRDDDDGLPEEELSPFPVSSWVENVKPGLPDDDADVSMGTNDAGATMGTETGLGWHERQPLATITPSTVPASLGSTKGAAPLPTTCGVVLKENQKIK